MIAIQENETIKMKRSISKEIEKKSAIVLNTIYNENCIDTMRRMQANFIDLIVTSPPYDNMRSYKGNSMEILIRSRTEVPKNTSKGVLYPNIFLGVLLIVATIAQRCAGEIQEISVPFLLYLRSNLFACSILPFCHGQ